MYTFKQIGSRYVVNLDNGARIVEALGEFCREAGIRSGSIVGIGAVEEATLRLYDPATKRYRDKTFGEQMELSNLTGNISELDGRPYLHLHVTLGRSDYTALAGHLLEARIKGAGEFIVDDFGEGIFRSHDPETGLNRYDF